MKLQRQKNIRQSDLNPPPPIDIDFTEAKKIFLPKLNLTIEDNPIHNLIEFFEIKSDNVVHLCTAIRPKGFKAYKMNDLKHLQFVRFSDFLAKKHPYINFNGSKVDYVQTPLETPLCERSFSFRESSRRNAFLVVFPNNNITLFDSKLNTLYEYQSSKFCEGPYDLRTVELASDLSFFCFTCISKAYLLDQKFKVIAVLQVPYKDGYEKRRKNGVTNPEIQKYLSILGLTSIPTQEELKSVFRKLIYRYHPDRNPDSPDAEEKAKALINAYESLSGHSISEALDKSNTEEFYWVNKKNSLTTEINGLRMEINIGPAKPDDWIYGAGFSSDNSQIYLGCYSGKIYQSNFDGSVSKIYIIPEDQDSDQGGKTNPLSFIYEKGEIKYFLSHYYLYVLENDLVINYVKCNLGTIRWFEEGIIHQFEKEIILLDKKGKLLGNILFKTPIRYVCYNEGLLLVELTSRTILFELLF
jgi:hypothetical protein